MSAFAKATARQSSLTSATRAKTGGKGIRTPDFQLAKLALYQLSYAPREFSILDSGLRIANGRENGLALKSSHLVAEILPIELCPHRKFRMSIADFPIGRDKATCRMPILGSNIRQALFL